MPNPFYSQRLQELEKLNPNVRLEDGIVAFCTQWGEDDRVFDFYAVTESNAIEGRLSGTPVGQYAEATNSWLVRSSGAIDFWVISRDLGVYRVSFCHPESACGMEVSVGYGFNCPDGMEIATSENKDRDRFKRKVRDKLKASKSENPQLTLKLS